jgi:hypothetical protein
MEADGRKKQHNPGNVRQKTRGQQHDAGDKNQQGIKEFFGGHNPLVHVPTDPHHGCHTLHPRQICPDKAGKYDDQHGIESSEETTEFDDQVDFGYRNERKARKSFKTKAKSVELSCATCSY